jgi:hypothetical protein
MNTLLRSLSLALVLGSLTACGPYVMPSNNGGGNAGGVQGGQPSAGVFMINNQSSTVICYAMISAHSDPNWGPDQLGSSTIPPGSSYVWTVGTGVWDVKLEDCNHNTLLSNTNGIDISASGTVLTVTN